MGKEQSTSPKSVREQIQDSAKDLWSTVMTLDKRHAPSRDTTSNDYLETHHVSLESVIRVMFGSCTNGWDTATDEPRTVEVEVPPAVPEQSLQNSKALSPAYKPTQQDPDAAYRKRFVDSRTRAEEAVSHLREHMEHQKPAKTTVRQSQVPAMFPASSPQRQIAVPTSPKQPPANIEQSHSDSRRPSVDLSFDDGISIITQQTLEELATQYEGKDFDRVHSDITQDPIEQIEESWKQVIAPQAVISRSSPGSRMSPIRIARSNRSHTTTHTKRSFGNKSMGTRSSISTQTNDFANVWQREEQRYWEDVVREQDGDEVTPTDHTSMSTRNKKLVRAREISRKARLASSERSKDEQNSKRDGTITTVHSTIFSGRSSNPEGSFAATQRDPDRFLNVLIMPPGTEIGEI